MATMGRVVMYRFAWIISLLNCYHAFRVYVPRTNPTQNISYLPFEPYEQGFVGYFGESTNYQQERINEGSPDSASHNIQLEDVNPRQICPAMVGPFSGGKYYCRGREYGYCDRRSGSCFCNMGYQGVDCGQCTSTHFKMGSLCYPKKGCPSDCSGHGNCNYTIGECVCEGGYWGEDCSKINCGRFHELCTRCSNTTCTTCAEGFSVQKKQNETTCLPCSRYDSRCSECNDEECLECTDPLLSSSRRSGYRHLDSPLLWDEQVRDLTVELPFGSQNPLAFSDSEPFSVVTSNESPLQDKAIACHQGEGRFGGVNDASWTCNSTQISHRVCGHAGTVSFASPTYMVSEGNGFIDITVVRSGGGHGAFEVQYSLSHITTDDNDVTSTAPYTTSTMLPFFDGSVAVTFKVTIHDDRLFEGDEQFMLTLHEPTGSSSLLTLGAQSSCIVNIIDNDQPLTGYRNSKIQGDFLCIAGFWCNFTISAYSVTGLVQFSGGDLWLAMVTNTKFNRRTVIEKGYITDNGNGTYGGTWKTETQGNYSLRVYLAVGGGSSDLQESGGLQLSRYSRNGGLSGTYFNSPFLEATTIVLERVDALINFTWGFGPLTPTASDFVTVRWEGAIMSPSMAQEKVEFTVICDDGTRLWIDHRLVIDEWDTKSQGRNSSALVIMNPSELYHIVLEYRELSEDAFISFWWKYSSITNSQIVPQSALYHLYELEDTQVSDKSSPIVEYKGRGLWNRESNIHHGRTVSVFSGETDRHQSDCIGQGLVGGTVGQELSFTIRPRDRYGNLRNDETLNALANDPFEAFAILMEGDGGYGVRTVPVSLTYQEEENEFRAVYNPTISGNYSLHVHHSSTINKFSDFNPRTTVNVNHTHVFGSPFNVEIEPTSTFPRRCDMWEIDDFEWSVGNPHTFKIRTRDRFGNLRLVGGDSFQVVAFLNRAGVSIHENSDNLGGEVHFDGESIVSESIFGRVQDHQNGNYTISLRPTKKGDYSVAVYLNGHHVAHSPYPAHCPPGVADAASSVAVGRGLYVARASFSSSFIFQARDVFGNDLEADYGGENMTSWTLSGHISSPTSNAPLSISSLKNGSALVAYTPQVAGEVLLSIFLETGSQEKEHISGSPFRIRVLDGPVLGSKSEAYGQGMHYGVAGKMTDFFVQARDAYGNKRTNDGDEGISYTDGRLSYSRQELAGVDPGSKDTFNVTLVLTTALTPVHTPAFRGIIYTGATSFIGSSNYVGDGLHLISYNVTASGMYNLSVLAISSSQALDSSSNFSANGVHIIGSPFLTYIEPASSSARLSLIWGHGLKDQVAGKAQHLQIQTIDLFGNNLTSGGDLIKIQVSLVDVSFNASFGPAFTSPLTTFRSAYRPIVNDDGRGQYKSSYVPLISGAYTARAVLFQRGGLDGTYFGSDEFTRPLETRQDTEINFDWGLYQYNSPSNELPDDEISVPAESTTSTTTILIPKVDFNNDEHGHSENKTHQENAKATGTAPADYWSVRWSGFLLSPSWMEEYTIYVDLSSADDSVAVFLDGQALIGGDSWQSTDDIHSPFKNQNPKRSSYDTSQILTEVEQEKEDFHAYEEIRYAFPEELTRLKNPQDLWATHPTNVTLSSASTVATSATGFKSYSYSFFFPRPNKLHTFEVVYRHQTGNAAIQLSWSSASLKKAVIPSSHLMRALPISDQSYSFFVRPAATHPSSSNAVGIGLYEAVSGVQGTFMIETRDEWGNLRLSGGDIVTAIAKGPGVSSFSCDVIDLGDGRYNVTYYAITTGLYTLSITIGSSGLHRDFGDFNVEESIGAAHIQGSPFRLRVTAGKTDGSSCSTSGEGTMRSTVGLGVSGRGANTSSIAFSKKNGGANFVIIAKDRHHNHRMFGGDVFDVKLVPRTGKVNAGVDINSNIYGVVEETVSRTEVGLVFDNKDGTYSVSYSSIKSGLFDLHIRLRPDIDVGLLATYFDNEEFLGHPLELGPREFQGKTTEYELPVISRVEHPPKFHEWPSLGENFASYYTSNSKFLGGEDDVRRVVQEGVPRSARWVGFVSVPITESYQFNLKSQVGLGGRIFLKDKLLLNIETFTEVTAEERTSDEIFLEEGTLYPITIELFGNLGPVEIFWKSDRILSQTIPNIFFHPPTITTDATEAEEEAESAKLFLVREERLLGEQVIGSPFHVYISPDVPFAAHCIALGLGRTFFDSSPQTFYGYSSLSPQNKHLLTLGFRSANQSSSITIQAHDVFGNLLDQGGASWFTRVVFNGPYTSSHESKLENTLLKATPVDLLNGTYTLQFTPHSVGKYTIEVLLGIPTSSLIMGYGANGTGSHGELGVSGTGVLSSQGGGLKAYYYSNPSFFGSPHLVRVDPRIDLASFSETGYIPTWPLTKSNDVSVRWIGFLKAPHSGSFSISFTSEQDSISVSLYLDDILLDISTDLKQVDLIKGVLYRIKVELAVEVGINKQLPRCSLEWESDRVSKQVIPSYFLFPAASHINSSPFLLNAYS